jgi:uncharacterized protein YkwD
VSLLPAGLDLADSRPIRPQSTTTPSTTAIRHRWTTGLVATLVSAALLAVSLLSAPAASAASSREDLMVAKINATRTSLGLHALHSTPSLMAYAHHHARSMADRGVLFHTTNFQVICCWQAVAENIGRGHSVAGLHRAFLASPPHRANLLNGSLRQVGIGIVEEGGQLWITEVFRRPA